jgi:hypothetical protein
LQCLGLLLGFRVQDSGLGLLLDLDALSVLLLDALSVLLFDALSVLLLDALSVLLVCFS